MPDSLGVIFDVDGVLVDSYRAHFQSWEELVAEFGLTYSEHDFAVGFGRTSREILAEFWGDRIPDLTPERIRQLDEKKEHIYRRIIAADFPAMDGARELIAALHAAGIPIAIGSSGPSVNVELVVDRLGIASILGGRVTGSDVTRGKPDPQIFLMAAQRLGLPASKCVVVEDARAGIRAAHAAGMKCFALVSTGHTPEELSEADVVVRSLREITPEIVRALAQST